MGSSVCTTCGEPWTFDMKPRRTECFRCHLRGIRIGFTHGKEDFHGPTVRERQKAQESIIESLPGGSERYVPAERSRWV